MKEIGVSDVPGITAWPIGHAARWIRVAARNAHMSPRWFGFVGPSAEWRGRVTEPYDTRLPGSQVYVWNSRRAIVLDDGDREWIIENMP